MKKNHGFTLTEVLLAVMIVGIIGVALASLTTAASRETGIGSSRVMLRNSLSVALRQLRVDVHQASRVLFVKGALDSAPNVASGATPAEIPLLVLTLNADVGDGQIANASAAQQYISYCFLRGDDATLASGDAVQPVFSSGDKATRDGGKIARIVWRQYGVPSTAADFCPATRPGVATEWLKSDWLKHVKFISSSYTYDSTKTYPVPLFDIRGFDTTAYNGSGNVGKGAVLKVHLIVELPSFPVVNEAVEELFVFSNGGKLLDINY